jgi:hypothetical protein
MRLISSLALSLVACGGSGGDGGSSIKVSTSDDYDTEQVNGGCPTASGLEGTKGSGEPCTSDKDCAPTCCQCPTSSVAPDNKWLAVECKNGKCANGSTACSTTQSSSFCQ